jgi:hypothetical protein
MAPRSGSAQQHPANAGIALVIAVSLILFAWSLGQIIRSL